jgi:hypothetical protein
VVLPSAVLDRHGPQGKLPAALAGLDTCPVLFVHDEIVLEVAEADADEAKQRLVDAMTEANVEADARKASRTSQHSSLPKPARR